MRSVDIQTLDNAELIHWNGTIGWDFYTFFRKQEMIPIVTPNGRIVLWVGSDFFDKTYAELSEWLQERAQTLVMPLPQTTLDIIRAQWSVLNSQ